MLTEIANYVKNNYILQNKKNSEKSGTVLHFRSLIHV